MILSADDFYHFECECGENLGTEENMIDICGDPFNGIVIDCPKCKKEYSIDLLFKVIG